MGENTVVVCQECGEKVTSTAVRLIRQPDHHITVGVSCGCTSYESGRIPEYWEMEEL